MTLFYLLPACRRGSIVRGGKKKRRRRTPAHHFFASEEHNLTHTHTHTKTHVYSYDQNKIKKDRLREWYDRKEKSKRWLRLVGTIALYFTLLLLVSIPPSSSKVRRGEPPLHRTNLGREATCTLWTNRIETLGKGP